MAISMAISKRRPWSRRRICSNEDSWCLGDVRRRRGISLRWIRWIDPLRGMERYITYGSTMFFFLFKHMGAVKNIGFETRVTWSFVFIEVGWYTFNLWNRNCDVCGWCDSRFDVLLKTDGKMGQKSPIDAWPCREPFTKWRDVDSLPEHWWTLAICRKNKRPLLEGLIFCSDLIRI